jgi:hypothetical protein
MPIKKIDCGTRELVFTSGALFIVPEGIYKIWISLIGGGGGGGGGGGANTNGIDGGGGAPTIVTIFRSPYQENFYTALFVVGGEGGKGGDSGYSYFFYDRPNLHGYNGQSAVIRSPWHMIGATGGQGGKKCYGGNGGFGGAFYGFKSLYDITNLFADREKGSLGGIGDNRYATAIICEGDSSHPVPGATGCGAGGGGGGGGSPWGLGGNGGSKFNPEGENGKGFGAGGGGGKGGGGDGMEWCLKTETGWLFVIAMGGEGGSGGNSGDCILDWPVNVEPGYFVYISIGGGGSGGSGGITYDMFSCPPTSYRFIDYWVAAGGSNGYRGGDGANGLVIIRY